MAQRVAKIKDVELRLGDSSRVMSGLPDESVELVICDPPYATTKHPWDIAPDLAKLLAEFDRILKPGGKALIFSAHPFTGAVSAALREASCWKYYELVWVKAIGSNQLNCAWRPLPTHENIFVIYRKGEGKKGYYKPQTTPGKAYKKTRNPKNGGGYGSQRAHTVENHGTRQPTTVLNFANPRKKGEHPTAKPVDLLAYLIRQYCPPNGMVLDPFMGGGSGAIAALNEERNYLGIDINENYVKLARGKVRSIKASRAKRLR